MKLKFNNIVDLFSFSPLNVSFTKFMNIRENVISLNFLWGFRGAISFHSVLPSHNSDK